MACVWYLAFGFSVSTKRLAVADSLQCLLFSNDLHGGRYINTKGNVMLGNITTMLDERTKNVLVAWNDGPNLTR